MSRFVTLSDLLLRYHLTLSQYRSFYDLDRRSGAAMLALMLHGQTAMEHPAHVNVAGLALSQERLTVHKLDTAAIDQVRETDVRSLPADPPRLLSQGFCVETADLSQPLFANVVNLGGYSIEGQWWMIGLQHPDGVFVGRWMPRWGDGDVESGFLQDHSEFVDAAEPHRELTIAGARFALTLGALLDAEGTPLDSQNLRQTEPAPKRKMGSPKPPAPYTWAVRYITLKPSAQPSASESAETVEETVREGLHPEKRQIRGFLRRQPHGPGRTERKWVYIASFEATRYVSDNPLRVRVEGEERP